MFPELIEKDGKQYKLYKVYNVPDIPDVGPDDPTPQVTEDTPHFLLGGYQEVGKVHPHPIYLSLEEATNLQKNS